MKKLINRPEDVVREALEGVALAHPDRLRVSTDPMYIVRADAPVMGKVAHRLRRRLRPRADARRLRGPGHARRRLPGRDVHLADPRPDDRRHAGRRRRRRRAPHRQELHRRRDELRDGRGTATRRGRRGRGCGDRRRRGRQGQPVHGRAPRRGRHHLGREDVRGGGRAAAAAGRGRRRVSARSTRTRGAWAWRSRPARCRWSASRRSNSATTRSRSASGSTASPGGSGASWLPRTRSSSCWRAASSRTCRSCAAIGCSPSSTAWAARR